MSVQITITSRSSGGDIEETVKDMADEKMDQIVSRGMRAAEELRNAALEVLDNASPPAPGSPPGAVSHSLRKQWEPTVESGSGGGDGVSIRPTIYSNVKYAPYLENGTRKMAARPFRTKVAEAAVPKIMAIYSDL